MRAQEVGLARGSKAKAFEHLQILSSKKESKSQEEEGQQSLDQLWEEIWTIESMSRHLRERVKEEIDPNHGI
jgi:hypothetical protein